MSLVGNQHGIKESWYRESAGILKALPLLNGVAVLSQMKLDQALFPSVYHQSFSARQKILMGIATI